MDNTKNAGFSELIKRGGVFRGIKGAAPQEILTNFFDKLSVPPSLNKKQLLDAVLEREALMPTAIGKGIALPHPRRPPVSEAADQFAAIAFLEQEVNWKALDSNPVHTVILIVSASAKLHLQTLSQINFLCQQESFRELLKKRSSLEEIREAIEEAEKTWGYTQGPHANR
jgi:PTS system nitrogen regulatory IIA component